MRSLRDIQTIVWDYPLAPDEYDLRRLCNAHLEHVMNVADITDWIEHETPNPYLRELYATQTAILLKEHCVEDDWNAAACEDVIEELTRIARRAFGSQVGDNLYQAEKNAYTQPLQEAVVQTVPLMQKLQEQMDYMNERLDDMERRLSSAEDTPHWPYYTAQATEKDKLYFEQQLHKWCASTKKSATQDIKTFLEIKLKEGIIYQPKQINDEWEALKEFGYKYGQSAYY